MQTLWLDFETFNETDIRDGTYKYAATAEVILAAYAVDDGPSKVWDAASVKRMPDDLHDALKDPEIEIVAHNAMFDRAVIRSQNWIINRHGNFETPDRWRCTMVQAMLHGFPGSLDQLCTILDVPQEQAKLKSGKSLIRKFCVPAPSNHKADRYDKRSHPKEWAEFVEYARMDIDAMREIHRRLPKWNCDWPLWRLDQKINDRGFEVDVELTEAGMTAAQIEKDLMAEEFYKLTDFKVARATQREQFRKFLNDEYDLGLKNTQKSTIAPLIGTLDDRGNRLLELAIMSNKTSTSKYKALHNATNRDRRFRGGLQFSGAARTRRWGGRTFQPQNLPSRGLPHESEIKRFIEAIKTGCHDFLFEDTVMLMSAALRGVLVAPEGKRLEVSDLSNIEGRMNAWLAGEQWKLDAFAAYDRGEGPDLYNVTAVSILGGDPYQVSKSNRNAFGKVPELALGYQGGFGAFQTFAKAYGIKMTDYEDEIMSSDAGEYLASAKANWTKWGKEMAKGADPEEWYLSECVKLSWRNRNEAITQLWYDCDNAARMALSHPGEIFKAGPHLKFKARKYGFNYLLCRMPSGKTLTYFDPRLQYEFKVTHRDGTKETIWAIREPRIPGAKIEATERDRLTYMGIDALTKQWRRLDSYGGKFVENACQSLSLDVLTHSMPIMEERGYEIVLTVHDEVVTEVWDDDTRSNEELSSIMSQNPPWAAGLPLAAAGFTDTRYRKD